MFDEILSIMESVDYTDEGKNFIPPTEVYEEGWLLRIILNWFNKNKPVSFNNKINFFEDSKWYSEALLPTQFLSVKRGDKLAERWTHADAVIGHFIIGNRGSGDLKLKNDCKQFVVIEAKIFSEFSSGTKYADYYHQAARIVGCMCQVISESPSVLDTIEDLAFYTIIPKQQKERKPSFQKYIDVQNIKDTIYRRVEGYKGRDDYEKKKQWYKKYVETLLPKIKIALITWEEIIKFIETKDSIYGNRLIKFYEKCLKYNSFKKHNKLKT